MSRQLLSACEKASFCSQWQLINSFLKQTLINLWPQHSNYWRCESCSPLHSVCAGTYQCMLTVQDLQLKKPFSAHCLGLKRCLPSFLLLFTWQLPILSWWFVYPAHKPSVIVWGGISASNISPVQSNTLLTALSNGCQLVLERPGLDHCSSSKPHFHTKCGSKTDEKRAGFFFRVLEEESWWWLFAAQLQDFVHCIERQQSVPVHACMSHCTGMLAPGTEQLTALTSVNKLIAGGRRTTQPLCWNWLQPLSHPADFNWFTSWKSVIYAHVQSLILQLDASCINLRELDSSFNNRAFSYQIQSKTNPRIKSQTLTGLMGANTRPSWTHISLHSWACVSMSSLLSQSGNNQSFGPFVSEPDPDCCSPSVIQKKELIIIRPSGSSSICFCLWPSWVLQTLSSCFTHYIHQNTSSTSDVVIICYSDIASDHKYKVMFLL